MPNNPLESATRLCESDHPGCTGLNPCPKCFVRVMVKVLPAAMRAAGFSKDKEQAQAFFRTYADSWKKMLAEKVSETPGTAAVVTPAAADSWLNAWDQKTVATVIETNPGSAGTSPPAGGARRVGGTKLSRGDVKRLAEKQAKESNGLGAHSGAAKVEATEPAEREE